MLGGWKRLADPCSHIAQAAGRPHLSRVLRTKRRLKVTAVETQTGEDRHEYGRPEEIPGPRSLPFIGTIYKYAPFFGEYSFKNYTQTAKRRYESYGKIVREEIFPGLMHYHVYDPKDIETMFREEGKTPMRIQLEGFKEYRLDRRHSPGLANSDGEDWYKLRSAVQQPMMRHSSVNSYMSMQFPVADDMVRNIRHLRDPLTGEVSDFLNELYKWAMEYTKAAEKSEDIITNKLLCRDIRKLSPLYQTSSVEAFHSTILHFSPEMTVYPYMGMLIRLYLAGMHFNENSCRTQAVNKKGEPIYPIKYPKYMKGDYIVKAKKREQTFDYVNILNNFLFNEVAVNPKKFAHLLDEFDVPPPMCSSYVRPDKATAVLLHSSRFK